MSDKFSISFQVIMFVSQCNVVRLTQRNGKSFCRSVYIVLRGEPRRFCCHIITVWQQKRSRGNGKREIGKFIKSCAFGNNRRIGKIPNPYDGLYTCHKDLGINCKISWCVGKAGVRSDSH